MVNKIRKISAYFTDTTEFFPDFTKSMEGYYENSKQYNLDVISDESLNIAIRKSGNFGCFKVYHDIDDFLNQWDNIKVINKKANEIIANVGKKETLEEAVDKYTPLRIEQKAFIAGAEYQAKRMYSEEDMVTFSKYCLQYLFTNKNTDLTIENLFEQFNKR